MSAAYELSEHARRRCQQRGIPQEVIGMLLDYGASVADRGVERYYMDKRARRDAEREMGPDEYARIVDHLAVYIVVKDSRVITVGRRLKRMRGSKPDRVSRHPRSRKGRS